MGTECNEWMYITSYVHSRCCVSCITFCRFCHLIHFYFHKYALHFWHGTEMNKRYIVKLWQWMRCNFSHTFVILDCRAFHFSAFEWSLVNFIGTAERCEWRRSDWVHIQNVWNITLNGGTKTWMNCRCYVCVCVERSAHIQQWITIRCIKIQWLLQY